MGVCMKQREIPAHDPYMPKYFFVTAGKAFSPISPLNAFDEALMDAGIAQCNLVPVSSILPAGAVEIGFIPITPGAIVFTIMARIEGNEGETISAGVAWSFSVSKEYGRYGIVVEACGKVSKDELREELMEKISRMAKVRRMNLEEIKMKLVSIKRIPKGMYGSVIAAVVFVPIVDYHKVKGY